jgi:CIC family chloride channel protein
VSTRHAVLTRLRAARAHLAWLRGPWRDLAGAALVGALGAAVVDVFKRALFALEYVFVGAQGGHLVAAAQHLTTPTRVFAPAIGGFAAGLLLWLAERQYRSAPLRHAGDYIEAVAIGRGRLDIRGGAIKVLASLLVVCTGGAVGREGAMVLLSAMAASVIGRRIGGAVDLRLVVSCGAAAGLAAAYHAPLASAMFVAEILLGSLALSRIGPVVVAAVISYGVTAALHGAPPPFTLPPLPQPGASQITLLLALGLLGGIAGAGLLVWLTWARSSFLKLAAPPPLAFALGGLVVGLLSLWRPEVWGNGYSSIQGWLTGPGSWQAVALVLVLKVIAVGATTGSGAPGGVFTPTLFVGAAFGALFTAVLHALGATAAVEPVYALLGMAVLLAATTHAPVMAALMVFEMTGQYHLLVAMLPACVLATLLSQRLHVRSVYGIEHSDTTPRPGADRDHRRPAEVTAVTVR